MNSSNHIVVAVDAIHEPSDVLLAAFELTSSLHEPALHVLMFDAVARFEGPSLEARREELDDLVSLAFYLHESVYPDWKRPPHDEELLVGDPAEKILARSYELRASHVVIPHWPRSRLRTVFRGSVDERVIAGAACPVLVVPTQTLELEPNPSEQARLHYSA